MLHGRQSWDLASALPGLPQAAALKNQLLHHDELPKVQELREDLWAQFTILMSLSLSCPGALLGTFGWLRHRSPDILGVEIVTASPSRW